jgi:hypothetical protein
MDPPLSTMKTQPRRIEREQRTIAAMLALYCRDHHGSRPPALCPQCSTLSAYARRRLETCPFQEAKPACNHCQVHCYSTAMRQRVKAVMRYAGPRLLWRHPGLSLMHLIDTWRGSPRLGS